MIDKVRAFIHRHQLLSEGAAVIVGVSGGPDSLALLHGFLSLRDEWKLQVIAAHVDHMFRGRESEEEMEFVKRFCVERRILCETAQIDVPAFQRSAGLGAQEAARICRYRVFCRTDGKASSGVRRRRPSWRRSSRDDFNAACARQHKQRIRWYPRQTAVSRRLSHPSVFGCQPGGD